jgi:hypothetical protein
MVKTGNYLETEAMKNGRAPLPRRRGRVRVEADDFVVRFIVGQASTPPKLEGVERTNSGECQTPLPAFGRPPP